MLTAIDISALIHNGDSGRRDVLAAMPSFVGGPLAYDDQFLITQESIGALLLYALRRMQPEEIAAWVGFLISPAGDVSSGNVIILNQGRDVR